MEEKLFINKSKKISGQKDILIAKEPKYDLLSINVLLEKLDYYLHHYNEKKLEIQMKTFLKKEV